jgi:hypothetical protein
MEFGKCNLAKSFMVVHPVFQQFLLPLLKRNCTTMADIDFGI